MQVILLTECEDHMQTDSCSCVLQHLQCGLQQLGAEGLEDPLQQPGHFDERLLMQEVCPVATQGTFLTLKGRADYVLAHSALLCSLRAQQASSIARPTGAQQQDQQPVQWQLTTCISRMSENTASSLLTPNAFCACSSIQLFRQLQL